MTGITEDEIVALTREIVDIPTDNPPGREGDLAAFLVDRLRSSPIDFDVESYDVRPGRPNVVARAGHPERGSLLLTGHMDVVPADAEDWTGDPFELRRVDDRIVGRGVSDMKGALAAKILAAETYLMEADAPGEIILGFVINEERGGDGTEALVEGIDADGAILGEPTRARPAIAQYGSVRYRVTVRGRSSHSGRPDMGVNAINGACRLVERLERLEAEFCDRDHALFEPGGSISVTEIEGGTAPNIIPNAVTMSVKWRKVPGSNEDPAFYHQLLEDTVEGIEVKGDPVDVEYEMQSFSNGVEVSPDERIVRSIQHAADDLGLPREPVGFNAGSDMRYLIPAGIPTVLLGPGSLDYDAHTVDESISVDELVNTARLYRQTMERFFEDPEE